MITRVKPDSTQYQQVVKLGDANSKTLGFLPYAAFKQASIDGRLLAFVEDGQVKGYALFGKRVRTGQISLTHLCVCENQQGKGIARKLVEGIVEHNPNSAGIRLLCRKDYEANTMWPKLGFKSWGEKPGRSFARHPLELWWKRIAALSLFDEPEQEEARLLVAIDTNILLDILEERDFPDSLALTANWVAEVAELAITAQSHRELSNQKPRSQKFKSTLGQFRTIEPDSNTWPARLKSYRQALSAVRLDPDDLQVVAQAAHGDAAYLVTRDRSLLQKEEPIERATGLKIVDPADFLLLLQTLGSEFSHQTRAITASHWSLASISRIPSNPELSAFCHHSEKERPAALRKRLTFGTGQTGHIEQIATTSGKLLALAAMYREQSRVIVTALRAVSGRDSYTAARQMVHHLRTIVAKDGPATIVIEDQTHRSIRQALRDEGFRAEGSSWQATVRSEVFRPSESLPQELSEIGWSNLSANPVRSYERFTWPSKIFSGSVKSYVVPIKPEFARNLIGLEDPQTRLFEPHQRAAVARDNTYYMTPRPSIEAPARIMWWVSGGGAHSGMWALSWLDAVDTGDPNRLYRKYQDRGVFSKEQVLKIAKPFGQKGQLSTTALLFSHTEMFLRPVPIVRARELCPAMRKKGYFVTTRKIDEDFVRIFYEEGIMQDDKES